MKTRILALAAIAVFALTAVAVAKTNTLTGTLKGKPGAKVTIKVKTNKKGVATKVSAISVSNFPSGCRGGIKTTPGKTVSANLGSFAVKKMKSQDGTTFYTIFKGGKRVNGNTFNLEITLGSSKGRSASGTIGFNYPNPEAGTCDGGGRFSAKVK